MTSLKASRRRSSKQKTSWRQRLVLIFLFSFPTDTFVKPANSSTSRMVSSTISGPKFQLNFSFMSVPDLKAIEVVASNRCGCLNLVRITLTNFHSFQSLLNDFLHSLSAETHCCVQHSSVIAMVEVQSKIKSFIRSLSLNFDFNIRFPNRPRGSRGSFTLTTTSRLKWLTS